MTDETTTTEDNQPEEVAPQTEPEADPDTPEVRNSDHDPEPQSKREARYRTQLRETEAERDQFAAKVEALQRAEVERLAANVIRQPSALWAADVELADLIDDDGLIDPGKVDAAVRTAQQALGLELGGDERKKHGPVVPREGTGRTRSSAGNQWEDAFK